MPAERYYCEGPLQLHQKITLEDREFQHLAKVMRTRLGQRVELINGEGYLALAEVCEIDKRKAKAQLEIVEVEIFERPKVELIIAQALPRANRLDVIVEKGTELGMTQLWLFAGEKSERKELPQLQWGRLKQLAIAATKQCGRLFVPQLLAKPSLNGWNESELPEHSYYGDVSGDALPLYKLLSGVIPEGKKEGENIERASVVLDSGMLFCIGPESGFSSREEAKLVALGAKGAKLHKNILRTDTAPLAALALFDHFLLMHNS